MRIISVEAHHNEGWVLEQMWHMIEELRDNRATNQLSEIHRYVSGWKVIKETDLERIIMRQAFQIEGDNHWMSCRVVVNKRQGTVVVQFAATGVEKAQ